MTPVLELSKAQKQTLRSMKEARKWTKNEKFTKKVTVRFDIKKTKQHSHVWSIAYQSKTTPEKQIIQRQWIEYTFHVYGERIYILSDAVYKNALSFSGWQGTRHRLPSRADIKTFFADEYDFSQYERKENGMYEWSYTLETPCLWSIKKSFGKSVYIGSRKMLKSIPVLQKKYVIATTCAYEAFIEHAIRRASLSW